MKKQTLMWNSFRSQTKMRYGRRLILLRDKEGTVIAGRPLYSFQDSRYLNLPRWRLNGVDSILIPCEWDAAFRGAPTSHVSPVFSDESLHQYLMKLNVRTRS